MRERDSMIDLKEQIGPDELTLRSYIITPNRRCRRRTCIWCLLSNISPI